VYEHAFEKSLADFEHRVRMCELCMLGSGKVEVSRIESSLAHPNYTLHTLEALLALYPDARLRLVVGADVLRDTGKWHNFDEVQRLAPLLPLGRLGYSSDLAPPAQLPNVSSTEIRRLLRGRSTARVSEPLRARLLRLVPQPVLQYIEENGLYRSS
jgi:nicotinate-nucleotide adenylyltransferase